MRSSSTQHNNNESTIDPLVPNPFPPSLEDENNLQDVSITVSLSPRTLDTETNANNNSNESLSQKGKQTSQNFMLNLPNEENLTESKGISYSDTSDESRRPSHHNISVPILSKFSLKHFFSRFYGKSNQNLNSDDMVLSSYESTLKYLIKNNQQFQRNIIRLESLNHYKTNKLKSIQEIEEDTIKLDGLREIVRKHNIDIEELDRKIIERQGLVAESKRLSRSAKISFFLGFFSIILGFTSSITTLLLGPEIIAAQILSYIGNLFNVLSGYLNIKSSNNSKSYAATSAANNLSQLQEKQKKQEKKRQDSNVIPMDLTSTHSLQSKSFRKRHLRREQSRMNILEDNFETSLKNLLGTNNVESIENNDDLHNRISNAMNSGPSVLLFSNQNLSSSSNNIGRQYNYTYSDILFINGNEFINFNFKGLTIDQELAKCLSKLEDIELTFNTLSNSFSHDTHNHHIIKNIQRILGNNQIAQAI